MVWASRKGGATRRLSRPLASIPRTAPAVVATGLLLAMVVPGVTAAGPAPSAPGERLWVSLYSGPGDDYDSATALGVSPDGSTVFVTGTSWEPLPNPDYATIAYDAPTGTELWASGYKGPGDDSDIARALGVSPDGSTVFVTGGSYGGASSEDYATIAYDPATGTELWASRYNGPGDGTDFARALGVSPNGSTVFVTGASEGEASFWDYATIAHDAATGTRRWASRYTGPGFGLDSAAALGVSPDGSTVFVTGWTDEEAGFDDFTTIAYDAAAGAELWVSRYDGPRNGDDRASALGVSPDGSSVFVTGTSDGGRSLDDYATIAYDAVSGGQLWVSRYDGPGNGDDSAHALGVAPDGNAVFVTGMAKGGANKDADLATVAHDATTGAELWATLSGGPGVDAANALGVSPDGSAVYITGFVHRGLDDDDYATVAYEAATGAKLWRRLDGKRGTDTAWALGVSPEGSRVFVTGQLQASHHQLAGYDYATLAFAT
jgi:WD40 repeat protein